MKLLTTQQLLRIMPATGNKAQDLIGPLNMAMERYEINTAARQAEYLAQIAAESGQLLTVRENLNYSAKTLMRLWPHRFPTFEFAQQYAGNPIKIANFVYANRMGNGPEGTGDGYQYRGAGWLQETGKTNHQAVADEFHVTLANAGTWLTTMNGASLGSAWSWKKRGCNQLADQGNLDAISDLINLGHRTPDKVGDANGYPTRLAFSRVARSTLGAL